MGLIAEWRNHTWGTQGSGILDIFLPLAVFYFEKFFSWEILLNSPFLDLLTWFASRRGACGLLLYLLIHTLPCPSGLLQPGGVLRWQEGHRSLRPGPSAQGLPEDPDQVLFTCSVDVEVNLSFQVGEGAWEEVLWKARGLRRPEEDPSQAHQEGKQAEAEAPQVNH